MKAAREQAKEQSAPYYTILTTTPGKLNTKEGRFAYEVYNSSVRWTEKFYDAKDEDELNNIIAKNTAKFEVVLLEFNHQQLGYSDEWLAKRIRVALSEGEAAESDYLNKWVAGGISSPIPKNLLKIIEASRKNEFNPFISKYGYIIRWYITNHELDKIKKTRFLSIGLDTSDALGGSNDSIGLIIRDSITGAVLGAGKFNETNLASFADFLVELLEEFPKSVLIPERRSSATAIMDNMFRIMVIKKMNPFRRIYNKIVEHPEKNQALYKEVLTGIPSISLITKLKRSFGFTTSGGGDNSRDMLYGNIFRSALRYTADKVYDPELIEQLAGLRHKNGRIDHESGSHDDLVIGWLLSMFILLRSNNLTVYGFSKDDYFSSNIDNELMSENLEVDVEKIKEQQKLKANIEKLISRMRNIKDEFLGMKILNTIKQLQSKIDTEIIRTFNIETLLEDIKLYRKLKKQFKKD